MNKILAILIAILTTFSLYSQDRKNIDIESIFQHLMQKHERNIQQVLQSTYSVDPFEKIFFSDLHFTKNIQTVSFFENLKSNLDRGESLGNNLGIFNVSYTSYTSINGVQNAVSYEYKSDGKNIIFIKGTMKDGQFFKAIYNYSPSGKQLETKEFKGKNLLRQDTYKYDT